jgi:serine/threonine protein kinase
MTNNEVVKLLTFGDGSVSTHRSAKHNGSIILRYTIAPELQVKSMIMWNRTILADRHPNTLMLLYRTKHRDGTVDIDTEYCDAGTLISFIPKFATRFRLNVAMSVALQLFMTLSYFGVVHRIVHRNINPRYIYTRADGCIKTDLYDIFDSVSIPHNGRYFLDLPYTAPECRGSHQAYFYGTSKNDTWSVGVIICAILLGKTLLPRRKAVRSPIRSLPSDTPESIQDEIEYQQERLLFEKLIRSDTDLATLVPNGELLFLVKKCLTSDPNERFTPLQAMEYIFSKCKTLDQRHPWFTNECPGDYWMELERLRVSKTDDERFAELGREMRKLVQRREVNAWKHYAIAVNDVKFRQMLQAECDRRLAITTEEHYAWSSISGPVVERGDENDTLG